MKELEQKTITSMEVAEMVKKPHNDLMKDIRRYVKQFGEGNSSHTEFFTESTYQTSQNKTMPCYLVTKKGCEFIAHKMTGVKGTQFTAKYINRFHEMEDALVERIPLTTSQQIQLLAQGNVELEQKINDVADDLQSLKDNVPLFGAESDELSAHFRRKGVELLGGKQAEAYKDNKIRQRVFRFIYNLIKNEYDLYDDDGKPKGYRTLNRKKC